jgi:P-type Ca2+ transporter type 2C
MEFYKEKLDEIYSELKVTEKGLSPSEARARLEEHGPNMIQAKREKSLFMLFLEQFNNPIIWVLLGALVISTIANYIEFHKGMISLMEMITEPIVIGAIIILNAIIGFIQEYKAEKAIEALKKMASLKSTVIRDGQEMEINAEELVPGDIILVAAGEKVPADARLISLTCLQVQEAALTGESVPVKKETGEYNEELELGDRKNMLYSGTIITDGKGKAVVVGTGMNTELGKIAKLIDSTHEVKTPLQLKLEKLGKLLTYLTIGVCIFIFGVLFLREADLLTALITAVSLAVAAIPEGLPAVVTISLALGVQRMVKRNALIRKLPSVETLGGTTVICTDKTGTLTRNEMTVKKVYVDSTLIEVNGSGYVPEGDFSEHPEDLNLLLKIGMLNNDAKLDKKEDGSFGIRGDPTEGALIVSGSKAGFSHSKLAEESPRVDEILFDSKRKRMTTVHTHGKKKFVYVKGAPDIILGLCSHILVDGEVKKLDSKGKKKIHEVNEKLANDALRVLGFAYKEVHPRTKSDYERDLIFVGLQGMIDPPREEVKEAIAKCNTAGIKVVMITGDYIGTASAIARDLGIEGKAIAGHDIDNMDLEKNVDNIGVYARVDPEHKMRIVEALKKKGHVVAMTGDGVNDAPALKAADIGISMGISGTDVAKEASDMILTDDNFASIVNAVEEGRGIYDNIKKFVQYLLSSNLGEILVIFFATILGMPLPLLAVQILWMNLVTDGFPAVALGVDPAARNIMKRKPRNTAEGILTRAFGTKVFYTGFLIAAGTLFVFWYNLNIVGVTLQHAQTLAFTTLVVLQFVRLHIIRSEYHVGMLSNKSLIIAVLVSLGMQLAVIYTALGKLFETVPLAIMDWGFIAAVSAGLLVSTSVIRKILTLIHPEVEK